VKPISSVKHCKSPHPIVPMSYQRVCLCVRACVSAILTAPQTPTCQDAQSGSSQFPTAWGLLDGSQKCSLSFSSPAPMLQDTCLCLIPFPQVTRHWEWDEGGEVRGTFLFYFFLFFIFIYFLNSFYLFYCLCIVLLLFLLCLRLCVWFCSLLIYLLLLLLLLLG